MTTLDVSIPTFNAAKNLKFCLASVEGLAANVLVVDSGTTDKAIAIASVSGARVLM